MTSPGGNSGTFNFAPSLGELVLYSFGRCGIRAPQLSAEHMRDARIASNIVLSDWANDQPNLWTVDLQTVQMVQGQSIYTVPSNTILILDAYYELNPGTATPTDLYMYPISRTEYSAFPNKTSQGRPTCYWFDRLIAPTVTVWQPPSDSVSTFNYYRVRQIQDNVLTNGEQPEIPYYFLKAFADALSAELAVLYAPDKAIALTQAADVSWKKARNRNSEDVPLFLAPGLSNYYRV